MQMHPEYYEHMERLEEAYWKRDEAWKAVIHKAAAPGCPLDEKTRLFAEFEVADQEYEQLKREAIELDMVWRQFAY